MADPVGATAAPPALPEVVEQLPVDANVGKPYGSLAAGNNSTQSLPSPRIAIHDDTATATVEEQQSFFPSHM